MEKFYIITNDMKDANRKITVKIKKCIESYGKKCYLEEQPEEGNFSKIKIPKDIDCVLTVGGDGTFIQASRRLFGRDLPMLGINMGTLGYLTEVEVQNVEEAVKLTKIINPKTGVPNHYVMFESNTENPEKYTNNIENGFIMEYNREYIVKDGRLI